MLIFLYLCMELFRLSSHLSNYVSGENACRRSASRLARAKMVGSWLRFTSRGLMSAVILLTTAPAFANPSISNRVPMTPPRCIPTALPRVTRATSTTMRNLTGLSRSIRNSCWRSTTAASPMPPRARQPRHPGLRPGHPARSARRFCLQQPRPRLSQPRRNRSRHQGLRPGDPAQRQVRAGFLQSRQRLLRQTRLRSRHRELRSGDPAQ